MYTVDIAPSVCVCDNAGTKQGATDQTNTTNWSENCSQLISFPTL